MARAGRTLALIIPDSAAALPLTDLPTQLAAAGLQHAPQLFAEALRLGPQSRLTHADAQLEAQCMTEHVHRLVDSLARIQALPFDVDAPWPRPLTWGEAAAICRTLLSIASGVIGLPETQFPS